MYAEVQDLVEVDSSAILDLFGSNQFLSCPQAMSFFSRLCPAPLPPISLLPRAYVQSLVGKLKSHKPCIVAAKKKKTKKLPPISLLPKAYVKSLVGKLKSHKPCVVAKKKKKKVLDLSV